MAAKDVYFDQFDVCVRAARAEISRDDAVRHFEAAIRACDAWYRDLGESQALELKATTLAELAIEEPARSGRQRRWQGALHELQTASDLVPGNPYVADAYAFVAVDYFQDILSGIEFPARQHVLRIARRQIDLALEKKPAERFVGLLLSRRSSILRHLASEEVSPVMKLQRLNEAVRCAELAVTKTRNPHTLLELANAEWFAAKLERSDDRYAERMRVAEQHLIESLSDGAEATQIGLARFYRMTFQSAKACSTYPRQTEGIRNVRAVLRDSYILAEAACQLWFGDYPEEMTRAYLEDARALLELAIVAGYRTARHVVTLAFVIAILDGVSAGTVALSEIRVGAEVDWTKAIEVAVKAEGSHPADLGFALGIDQAGVWTRLGTFARRFMEDLELAEMLYREAVRIDARDPIALTNLARFLVMFRGATTHQEARRLLQKAQTFADRRFIWWRSVLAQLDGSSSPKVISTTASVLLKPKATFQNRNEIRTEFRRLTGVADRQQRGYELERLVFELAKLTVGTAAPSYRIERAGGAISQIDGFFQHGSDRYRIECKWRDAMASHDDIALFADKIDVAGVGGLFISMSGFTPSAIGRAREFSRDKVILLMDGEELYGVMEMRMNFDEAIAKKRTYFDQRSEPYHRTVSMPLDEPAA